MAVAVLCRAAPEPASFRRATRAPEPGCTVTRVPIPGLGPRDVLVRVKAASICGTDLHIVAWDKWAQGRIRPPLVFGHEFCGEVEQVGAAVTQTEVGAFVSVEGHIADGDFVVIRKSQTCENGEKVIAMIDRAMTLKKYYRKKDTIRLEPMNATMEPIIVDPARQDVQILGVLAGVIRKC